MSGSIELSRKILNEAGGWQEMKRAKSIHAAGRVSDASFEGEWLEGNVRDSGKTLKVRMQVKSRTDMENHCPCFRTRRDGIICAHALAVGLEVMEPTAKTAAPEAQAQAERKVETPTLSPDWPSFTDRPEQDSVEAKLSLIFTPNLVKAWQVGSVTVGVEIESAGERQMLKAFRSDRPLFLDSQDIALIRILQTILPETVPATVMLTPEQMVQLLNAVPGHPRITFGKKQPAQVSFLPHRPELRRTGKRSFAIDWPAGSDPLPSSRGTWVVDGSQTLQPVAPGLPADFTSIFERGLTVPEEKWETTIPTLQRFFDFGDCEIIQVTPEIVLDIEGSLNHLDATFSFQYPEPENNDSIQIADIAAEQQAFLALVRWGFAPKKPGARELVLKDREQILRFFAHGLSHLQQKNWTIHTGERFEHAEQKVEPVSGEMEFHPGSGENWFEMEVEFATSSGEVVARSEIQRLLKMGQNHKKLANGKIAVLDVDMLDEFSDVLTDCDPNQVTPGQYRIDRAQADYLKETADDLGFSVEGTPPWSAKGPFSINPISDELEKILRPYQKVGVEWMQNLAARGRGGILADDMGLGKTLQTLTFIQSVGGPALVVCPSSLVSNWVAEAEKFVPDLKAVAIEGPGRKKVWQDNGDADIFVTSYALLRRDEELYRESHFTVVIVDEAQQIKNPDAKISKAVHRLNGQHRFALTGTPIENSVRDLWSVAQFACPGYLGQRKEFTERFEKPISGSGDSASVQNRLSRRLRPIILRRLKQEVAKDLPEKIEQVLYCDLNPTQKQVYQQILRESKESILDSEGGRKRMLALTALLRLRQACCDLRLLGLNDVDPEKSSVKVDALEDILSEAIEGGHRILVFSQFVEMLQILVPTLAEKGIQFCYLDGNTKNRGDVVAKFQNDETIPVFLISLKAGGVGLNLTGADTVIHVDPWWNPAVEAQATDRAHRIGQTRVVTSYKLIARNTVEEKILSLQNKKREMMESLLADSSAAFGDGGITEEEMLELLE